MIIPDSFRNAYDQASAGWEPIKDEVDGIFHRLLVEIPATTYKSRIKPIDSVLIKSQKGEYEFPFTQMEDFFACQLIIPSTHYFSRTIAWISEKFLIEQITSRQLPPSSFDYNDKHYKVRLKDSPLRSDKSVINKPFELQIKTLLQYAWQQSSHNVVYKSKKISYWTERIACQLRAVLELADDVLAQMENTANVLHNQSEYEDDHYKQVLKQIIEILAAHFSEEELPIDRRRIANIIKNYIELAGVDIKGLEEMLKASKEKGDPVLTFLSLTVPDKVFIILYQNKQKVINEKFNSGKAKILITDEMEDFFPELRQLNNKSRVKLNFSN